MKFSYSFIKTFVPKIPAKQKFVEDLNSYSFETENLEGDMLDISLPSNRYGDGASHLGIAREAGAIYGAPLKNPVKTAANLPAGKGLLKIEVKDPKFCARYSARYFEIKKVGNSSREIQDVLKACGLKPINAIVDVMNFVMLEVGQPLHAFDADKVEKKIVVRKAKGGEKIETLDGQKFILAADDYVIADEQKALAIAGIKGGANSGVESGTKRIIVEAANFAPVSIFKTSRRLKLHTDASVRFSHGLSPVLVDWGMDRATELLLKMGAKPVDSAEAYPRKAGERVIGFDPSAYEKLIGAPVSFAEAKKYFTALGFRIEQKGSSHMAVHVPPWRTDIERVEDLIDELARLKGLNNLKPEPPAVSIRSAEEADFVALKDRVRQFLVHAHLSEVYNYSFGPEAGAGAMALENPINEESGYLRKSLEPGLLRNVASNARFFDDIKIFEVGKVFAAQGDGIKETLHVGAALGGKRKGFVLELKGILNDLLKSLGLTDFLFVPRLRKGYAGQAQDVIEIETGHQAIGAIKTAQLEKNWIAAVGELDLSVLLPLIKEEREFKPLPKYPAVIRDISLFVSGDVRIGDLLEAIQDAGGELVDDVDLVDEYRDEKSGGRQSLTFRIVFQAEDRTLTDGEVNAEMEKVSVKLKKEFHAEVR